MGAPSGFSGVQRVPKAGQSMGFFRPLQNLGADALGGLFGGNVFQAEHLLRIEGRVLLAQPQSAHRDAAHAAPFSVAHFKHLVR